MTYRVTKTFGHDRGYSVAFRQPAATDTHCSKLHGYSLGFKFDIDGEVLDHRNWLFSFGEFKDIKAWLDVNFDHTTLIATDDPLWADFHSLGQKGALKMVTLEKVGCEAFAEYIYFRWSAYIEEKSNGRAHLVAVTVSEHAGNSATYWE